MFDIKSLQTADTAVYHVTNAKGVPQYDGEIPITITAYGPGTKRAAQAKFDFDQKTRARTLDSIGGKVATRTEAEERKERAEYLGQLVQSLDGFSYEGGASALFADPKLRFVADGFEKWWNDAGNFSGNSVIESPSA